MMMCSAMEMYAHHATATMVLKDPGKSAPLGEICMACFDPERASTPAHVTARQSGAHPSALVPSRGSGRSGASSFWLARRDLSSLQPNSHFTMPHTYGDDDLDNIEEK